MTDKTKTCNTCAWYCHSDGKCYGACADGLASLPILNTGNCSNWSWDGLTDEEREEYALMTKETEHAAEYA